MAPPKNALNTKALLSRSQRAVLIIAAVLVPFLAVSVTQRARSVPWEGPTEAIVEIRDVAAGTPTGGLTLPSAYRYVVVLRDGTEREVTLRGPFARGTCLRPLYAEQPGRRILRPYAASRRRRTA
jgi:hypothetical protein